MAGMAPIGERIEVACRALGISRVDLAENVGVSKQYIYHICTGKIEQSKHLPAIANALGVEIQWLTTGTGKSPTWWTLADSIKAHQRAGSPIPGPGSDMLGRPPVQPPADGRTITPLPAVTINAEDREVPIIGLVAANSEKWGEIEQPELRQHRFKKSLALVQVMGDSAYPVAFPGQYVVVDTDRPVHDQNLVVVVLNDGRALLKRYCAVPGEPGRMLLASVNIGLGSLLIDRSEVRYLHPVVGVMFE